MIDNFFSLNIIEIQVAVLSSSRVLGTEEKAMLNKINTVYKVLTAACVVILLV